MKHYINKLFTTAIFIILFFCSCSEKLKDEGLSIGWAMEDITPEGPVSLQGQYYERISEYVQSPLKVTACAIEKTDDNGKKEQAIMVSLDLVNLEKRLQDTLRVIVREQIPDFDTRKLLLNATHTHSAFRGTVGGEYSDMLLDKLNKAVVSAWNNRKPAGVSRGLGYAVVGHNRRARYADGTAQMYGSTDRDDFIGMEGGNDGGVDMLFCWDMNKKLTGIIMNVTCPSQVTEAKYYVSADYWSEVRKQLADKFSEDVYVLPQCGAAGDLSPRDLPRGYKAGTPNMWDIPGIIEIGKRLIAVVEDVYPEAKNNIRTDVIFKHSVKDIDLPTRRVSEEEYQEARSIVERIRSAEPEDPDDPGTAWNRFLKEIEENEKIKEHGPWDNKLSDFGVVKKKEALIEKYLNQENDPFCRMELHVIRIGDIVMATNPFELYLAYGNRITGRSKAKQTFIVQLCSGKEGYLPTRIAIEGGGYSAMVNRVGPKGGKVLVDETVNVIDSLWKN